MKLLEHVPKKLTIIDKEAQVILNQLGCYFKMNSLRAAMLKFVLYNFNENDWMKAVSAIKTYKNMFNDSKDPLELSSINSIIIDVNRAYVLHCCSYLNFFLAKKNPERSI
jgi:hypothetical protein